MNEYEPPPNMLTSVYLIIAEGLISLYLLKGIRHKFKKT